MNEVVEELKLFNPRYANEKLNLIDCEIDHPNYGLIPFTADKNDVESYGVEIYNRLLNGEFGEISAYQPPPPKTTDQLAKEARLKRDELLREFDLLVSNPLRWDSLNENQKSAYAKYRQDLLDVPEQTGFPTAFKWPVFPN